MHSASPWYTSGTFWAGAGVVVALLVGVATVLVTWSVGTSKRKMIYSVPTLTSLLPYNDRFAKNAFSDLEIMHNGAKLSNPYIISLRIENVGRKDIRSSDFDQGRPLLFHINASIVTMLGAAISTEMRPESFRLGRTNRGDVVEVGPALFKKNGFIAVDLLTDGKPMLVCESPLIDVTIKEQNQDLMRRTAASFLASVIEAALLRMLSRAGHPHYGGTSAPLRRPEARRRDDQLADPLDAN